MARPSLSDEILRSPAVEKALGVDRSTLYRWSAANKFPRRVVLGGGRASGYLKSEIEKWLRDRAAERDGAEKVCA